ncbi:hypothetical protein GOP47_0020165 [Adiantum capillus-veneris]|uniref:Uncharacterized protein n=1 Tax=Adiantum capillus-veneris TaxID=13818 RepID=A0A9D4Z966_ADICA|nr:hypothetical protein GOP47_0020165 [Adiantum capillus-veneris]
MNLNFMSPTSNEAMVGAMESSYQSHNFAHSIRRGILLECKKHNNDKYRGHVSHRADCRVAYILAKPSRITYGIPSLPRSLLTLCACRLAYNSIALLVRKVYQQAPAFLKG